MRNVLIVIASAGLTSLIFSLAVTGKLPGVAGHSACVGVENAR